MKNLKLSTRPYIYNVDNVNIITFFIMFPIKVESKYMDLFKMRLASKVVASSSKKCTSLDAFDKVLNKNLVIRYLVDYIRLDKEIFITFDFTIPKEGLIADYNMEEAIKVLYDCIFNPSVKNNKFTKEVFDWNKDKMLNNLKQEINNIYELTNYELYNILDPKHKVFFSREEKIKLVEDTNASNVYEYYKKNIIDNKFITFIYGKIDDKKRLLDLYNKYFKQKYYDFNMGIHMYNLLPFKEYKNKTMKTKYWQSSLSYIYQIVNCKMSDINKLTMLYYFLRSRENDLIFDKLRNEYNLVYETYVDIDKMHGLLEIKVLLDKNDREEISKLIKEVINSLYDKEVFVRCKKKLMKSLEYDLLDDEDNDFYDVLYNINKKLKISMIIKDLIRDMSKIEYNDMRDLLNRLKISRELFLEGGYNEEGI